MILKMNKKINKSILTLSLVAPFGVFVLTALFVFSSSFRSYVLSFFRKNNRVSSSEMPVETDVLTNYNTLGVRINNPLNIRYNTANSWTGQTGQESGFSKFKSVEFGLRAGIKLIQNYATKYNANSVHTIISKFAPPSENDTKNYIKFVTARMGVTEYENIGVFSKYNMFELLKAMCKMESQYVLTESVFDKAYNLL